VDVKRSTNICGAGVNVRCHYFAFPYYGPQANCLRLVAFGGNILDSIIGR
jgi:hypothetical protein